MKLGGNGITFKMLKMLTKNIIHSQNYSSKMKKLTLPDNLSTLKSKQFFRLKLKDIKE